MRWGQREGSEHNQSRAMQSFCVPKAEIAATISYDLSLNRYKQVEHEERTDISPNEIVNELRALEKDISSGLNMLEEMLG